MIVDMAGTAQAAAAIEASAPVATEPGKPDARAQLRLGEIGLAGFAPYLLNRVVHRHGATLRLRMAELGLTPVKARVLAVLSVIEGPLIRDLAGFTATEQSTLSRSLDALAAGGLIRREPDPQDSRGVRVLLTPAGREVFETLWPHMAARYAALFRGFSDEELRLFVAMLQRLLANLDQPDLD